MDHKSRGPGRPAAAWPPVAIGVCILRMECSQILYNAVNAPRSGRRRGARSPDRPCRRGTSADRGRSDNTGLMQRDVAAC